MKRKIAGLLGAFSLGAVAVLGAGSTAQAQEADVEAKRLACLGWYFCLYQHDDFRGANVRVSYDTKIKNLASSEYRFDNAGSSMSNNTAVSVTLYRYKGYAGTRYVAKKQSEDKDFTNNGFDNKASSLRVP
ncbi:peptidase inhibitor family I36 protein [Streptomyces sp. NPDC048172]|uniref:peptidase inhibitor family I36 protein n=1 Tax=Streptomyces sp. NPDC048172 TaxID=3365505 RepID=UPI00371AF5C9